MKTRPESTLHLSTSSGGTTTHVAELMAKSTLCGLPRTPNRDLAYGEPAAATCTTCRSRYSERNRQ